MTDHTPGLCQCGCGETTRIAPRTTTSKGHVKGQPYRFVNAGHAKRGPSLEAGYRIMPSNCWEWQGWIDSAGYGRLMLEGVTHLAHRLAYATWVAPIPPGMEVCHSCDNPPCINPGHLFVGTHAANMRDMSRKSRHCGGVSYEAAQEIRERRASGERGVDLAREFGISEQSVCDIHKGRHFL